MPFLTCNGVTIPVAGDSWFEEPERVGEVMGRELGNFIESRSADRRRWTFRLPHMSPDDDAKYRAWIEGRGQSWRFSPRSGVAAAEGVYGSAGVTASAAGTFSIVTPAVAPPQGTYALQVNSGSQFGVDMSDKLYRRSGWTPTATDGWSMGFWTYRTIALDGVPANGWYYFIAVSTGVAVTRGSSANPASVTQYRGLSSDASLSTGSFNIGNIIDVLTTSPYVALRGYELDNNAANQVYQDWWFFPFAIPSTWPEMIFDYAKLNEVSQWPFVSLQGDAFREAASGSSNVVESSVRYSRTTYANAKVSGTFYNNARMTEFMAQEI